MDDKAFDALVAKLASGPSRRDALKGAVGGALAAVGLSAEASRTGTARKRRGATGAEGLGNNATCRCPGDPPRGKTRRQRRRPRPCERCNSGFFQTKNNGRCICVCRPDRTACDADKAFQCCSGICQGGECVSYGDATT